MDIVDPFCEWSAGTVEVTFQKGVERGKRVTLDSAQLSRGASYTFEKQLTYTTQFEQETDAQSEAQIPGGLIRAILSKKNKFVAGKTESVTRSLTVQGNECLGWDLFQQEVWQVGVARQTWTHKKTKEQRVTREPIRIMTHLTMIAQAKNCPKAASKTVETPVEANLVARGAGAEDQKARDETEVKPPT